MTRSMTGFASHRGTLGAWSWAWEMRSVNGRGLDIRLRLPDTVDGIEQPVRQAVQKKAARGNVSVSLKLSRDAAGGSATLVDVALAGTLAVLREIEEAARAAGLTLGPTSSADIAALPGILSQSADDDDVDDLRKALLEDVSTLLDAFDAARAAEGAALNAIIGAQIDRIADLTKAAHASAEARSKTQAETLHANVAKVLGAADGVDEARIAQELAILAVKADVTEELDRLRAHVDAARTLLNAQGPKGRKLDFLMQEFNREANTLCSKSGSTDLTGIGLDLKTVIDQMREQVQNVE